MNQTSTCVQISGGKPGLRVNREYEKHMKACHAAPTITPSVPGIISAGLHLAGWHAWHAISPLPRELLQFTQRLEECNPVVRRRRLHSVAFFKNKDEMRGRRVLEEGLKHPLMHGPQ